MKALQELIQLDLATQSLWNVDMVLARSHTVYISINPLNHAAYISIYPLKPLDRDAIQSSPQNRFLSYIIILLGPCLQINMKTTMRDSLQGFSLLIWINIESI